jgi:ribosomal protein S18 acetylase RimI-like enzyme
MEQIEFRPATTDDVSQLVELRFRMIFETAETKDPQRTPEFEKQVHEYFVEGLLNQSYFGAVAEVDGRLVSTNGLVLYRKPPSFRGMTGLVGYVSNVYTLPEFRNRGMATELMKILVEHAKCSGAGKIQLGTTDDGRALYEKFGFKDIQFPALELRF